MNKIRIIPIFLLLGLFLIQIDLEAQCAMCKAVLESNMQSGEDAVGKGINNGIMYIMFVPYLLLGVGGYLMYKYYLKPQQASK
jgi:hypothetical protein